MLLQAAKLRNKVSDMLSRKIEDNSIVFRNGSAVVLTIVEEETENGLTMTLRGELRSDVAHELLDELTALATVGVNVVVDFAEVTYITSTILDVFLTVQQLMDSMQKGELVLRKLSAEIYREFEKTGTSELLIIEN